MSVSKVKVIEAKLLECIVPTYFLDEAYTILAWNDAFAELFAKPLGIKLGDHAVEFVSQWENHEDALARSAKVFAVGSVPLVDHEYAAVKVKPYGRIELQKLATQVHTPEDGMVGWVVSYNIRTAERLDALFDDLMRICAARVNRRV